MDFILSYLGLGLGISIVVHLYLICLFFKYKDISISVIGLIFSFFERIIFWPITIYKFVHIICNIDYYREKHKEEIEKLNKSNEKLH